MNKVINRTMMVVACFLVGVGISLVSKVWGISNEASMICSGMGGVVVATFWKN